MKYILILVVVLVLLALIYLAVRMKKGNQGKVGGAANEHSDQFTAKTVIGGGPSIDDTDSTPPPVTDAMGVPSSPRPPESTVPSEQPATPIMDTPAEDDGLSQPQSVSPSLDVPPPAPEPPASEPSSDELKPLGSESSWSNPTGPSSEPTQQPETQPPEDSSGESGSENHSSSF